jgi:hypothetical protein
MEKELNAHLNVLKKRKLKIKKINLKHQLTQLALSKLCQTQQEMEKELNVQLNALKRKLVRKINLKHRLIQQALSKLYQIQQETEKE